MPTTSLEGAPPILELLGQPAKRGAREVALRLLEQAESAQRRLDGGDDPEALHDFRVAVRRLRSWLKAYKDALRGSVSGKHRDVLRSVAHSTNAGRDAEVHIEWLSAQAEFFRSGRRAGAEWLIERLRSAERTARDSLRKSVKDTFDPLADRLVRRLEVYPSRVRATDPEATFAAVTAERLRELTADLRARIGEVGEPGDQHAIHAARIAAKHLRYLLEPVASEVEAGESMIDRLKNLQDVLGAVHDAHVFAAEVAQAMVVAAGEHAQRLSSTVLTGDAGRRTLRRAQHDPARPGLLAVARRLRATADDSFSAFASHWKGSSANLFWDESERSVASLRALGGAPAAAERRYLLAALPDRVKRTPALEVEQGRLPGKHVMEHLRRIKDPASTRFYRTVDVGTGVVRTELEEETTRAVFARMWPLTKGRRLKKRHHRVFDGKLTWGIDDYGDRKLVLACVALPDPEADVEIPKWLQRHIVREVTKEEEYQNQRLAR